MKDAGTTGYSYGEEMNLDPPLKSHKYNEKWVFNLNIKKKTTELLEEKNRRNSL